MPKCPKCKAEIEVLSYSAEEYGKFYLNDKKQEKYNPKGGNGYNYNCPECDYLIALEEEEAIKFLNS